MKRLLALALAACGGGGGTSGPDATPPGPPATSRPIVFVNATPGAVHIWSVGAELRNLTTGHGWSGSNHFPTLSEDGATVVFCRYASDFGWANGEYADLVAMNADGSNPVLLTNTPLYDERTPTFAQGYLYYARNLTAGVAAPYEIFRRPFLGSSLGAEQRITFLYDSLTEDPRPAPDGRIFFQTVDATRVARMNGDGSQIVNFPLPGAGQEDPAVFGTWVLYAAVPQWGSPRNLWIMDVNGGQAQQLTFVSSGTTGASEPCWSPDGTRVAWEDPEGLRVADLVFSDGSVQLANVTTLVPVSAAMNPTFPRWGP